MPHWNDYVELSIAVEDDGKTAPVLSTALTVMASGEVLAYQEPRKAEADELTAIVTGQIAEMEEVLWREITNEPQASRRP